MTPDNIYVGEALKTMRAFPSDSIDCIITSPPYWALRNYDTEPQIWDEHDPCQHDWQEFWTANPNASGGSNDKLTARKGKDNFQESADYHKRGYASQFCRLCEAWRGSLGNEPTIDLYVRHLTQIFEECRRILKPTGTFWLNIGDTYMNDGNDSAPTKWDTAPDQVFTTRKSKTLPAKTQCQIPHRVAISLIDKGWIIRNTIIWHKPNAMPESVTDRFTDDFEYLFFMSKSQKYFYQQQLIPYEKSMDRWGGPKNIARGTSEWDKATGQRIHRDRTMRPTLAGRNMRSVWSINTESNKEAHFAVFPTKLIEIPINSGCPERICLKCGTPKVKKIEYGFQSMQRDILGNDIPTYPEITIKELLKETYEGCECNAGTEPGIVLDPFLGSGTTAVVAKKLRRKWIGIELNPEYAEIARKRINSQPEPFL